jgi:hypothetical protein
MLLFSHLAAKERLKLFVRHDRILFVQSTLLKRSIKLRVSILI